MKVQRYYKIPNFKPIGAKTLPYLRGSVMVQSVMLRASVLKLTPTFTTGRLRREKLLSYCFNSICSIAASADLLSFISMM